MKRLHRAGTLALALMLLVALALPAAATNETKSIDITYRGISVAVDEKVITPADASGNPVEPFIYNGTTYLPLRAVAGALGLSVEWDAKTSTAMLTSGGTATSGSGKPAASKATKTIEITYRDIKISIDGKQITPKDASGNTVEPFIYNGTTYLPIRAVASALGVEVGWDGDTSTAYLGKQPENLLWLVASEKYYDNAAGEVYHSTTYTYDAKGNMIKLQDSDGFVADYTYDAAGNQLGVAYDDGDWEKYTYDAKGNVLTARYSYGGQIVKYTNTYDAAGNMLSSMDGNGNGTTYTYDAAGNVTKVTNTDGTWSVYTRDAKGRILTSIDHYDTFDAKSSSVYDAVGNLIHYESSDAYYSLSGDSVYDKYNNCTKYSYTIKYSDGTVATGSSGGEYTYDAAGNILSRTETYTNDGVTDVYYYISEYNAKGDMTKTYTYHDDGGVRVYDDTNVITYDAHGNILKNATDSGYS
ncbi:MAG: stalk domain-containing protein, partial [Oscillospiraceae bacterium]